MIITGKYCGHRLGEMQYLVLVLVQDYIYAENQMMTNLEPHLLRLASDMDDAGAVLKPFLDAGETTQTNILTKPWSEAQKERLSVTPGVLVIDCDFDAFSPAEDPWLHISLRDHMNEYGQVRVHELGELFGSIADACTNRIPLQALARGAAEEQTLRAAGRVFEVKPAVFGVSFDLRQAAAFLRGIVRGYH